MPNERWEHLAELVKSAVALEPEQWSAFLDQECDSDPAMRAEIESLLAQHKGASRFIETPALHLAAKSFMREAAYRNGQVIGDYEIISLIGRGGMGEVYLARDRKLGRKVALKFVQRGLNSEDLIRHFKREESLLASLNHPNIAQLYGGGIGEDGSPFFAMEYVEGQRLDEFCNERSLTTKERLEIFRKVCSAVTYAHQHLVIHRDLKPANIRVTPDGEPKLLDFGIAKLLDPEAHLSELTITLGAVMTPEYASPEQVRGDSMTTASDIYSLGVVLYELLTGLKPYNLTNRNPTEVSRAITEQEPTRPSLVVDRKSLRGDLDNIILMALRKEPTRRYSSVGQFSEDVRRSLEGLPIIARKDTWTYRSAKFVRRHRVGVAAAALVLLSLVGGILATTRQAQVARHEKTKAENVKNALVRMLNYSTPVIDSPQHAEKTVKEVLDEAASRLDQGEFSDQPEIKVELEQILSACYFGQGDRAAARKHHAAFVDLHRKLYGEDDAQTLLASADRAGMLFEQGKLAESEKTYRKVLPLVRKEKQKGSIKAEALADVLRNFAFLRRTQGDSKEAEALFRETLAQKPEMPQESLYLVGQIRSTLASTLADQGRLEEALLTAREAVSEFRERSETDTPNFSFALNVLGGFLTDKGDYKEADKTLGEAEAIQRKLLNPLHLWLGDNLRNQSISFYQQGRYAEALDKVKETLRIYRESFGTHYDNYPTALLVQGLSLVKTGHPGEGENVLREAVKIRTESLPKEHYWVALADSALGECLTIQERYVEAEPLLLSSYESLKSSQGANNPRTKLALQRLVSLYEKWQKADLVSKYSSML